MYLILRIFITIFKSNLNILSPEIVLSGPEIGHIHLASNSGEVHCVWNKECEHARHCNQRIYQTMQSYLPPKGCFLKLLLKAGGL